MGTIRHELVILNSSGGEFEAKVDALRAAMPEKFRRLLVGPIQSAINDDRWYAFFPDGSKEYWCTSEDGNVWRAKFKALAPYPSAGVHVAWGDEDPASTTVSWACEPDEDCWGGRADVP